MQLGSENRQLGKNRTFVIMRVQGVIIMDDIKIIGVRDNPEYLERAADYFHSKWGVPRVIYYDSISMSLDTPSPLPRWYLMLKGDEIIGSYGLIVNDFISRQDLWPWLAALYIKKSERGKELGSYLLEHARKEASKLGFPIVYLSTNHVGYYEKYGWKFIAQAYDVDGGDTRIYGASST